MGEMVEVNVDPYVEAYPVLVIREALGESGQTYRIPASLLDALMSAQDLVADLEAVIMEHIGQAYPDAQDVDDWLQTRRDDKALTKVRAAWAAEHPDGPEWQLVPVRERDRLLRAAGWGGGESA